VDIKRYLDIKRYDLCIVDIKGLVLYIVDIKLYSGHKDMCTGNSGHKVMSCSAPFRPQGGILMSLCCLVSLLQQQALLGVKVVLHAHHLALQPGQQPRLLLPLLIGGAKRGRRHRRKMADGEISAWLS
jgi:hypothetical protein